MLGVSEQKRGGMRGGKPQSFTRPTRRVLRVAEAVGEEDKREVKGSKLDGLVALSYYVLTSPTSIKNYRSTTEKEKW